MDNFIISALATWRIASLLVNEDGPFDVFTKIREKTGVKYDEYSRVYGTNLVSNILTCVWCCSVWVAFFIALFNNHAKLRTFNALLHALIQALALSASAILIERIVNER